jgi:hypothetical protein
MNERPLDTLDWSAGADLPAVCGPELAERDRHTPSMGVLEEARDT